jgi:peptidoglycan/xylan/chitin deacetylase (PgdA/CDA1 family)
MTNNEGPQHLESEPPTTMAFQDGTSRRLSSLERHRIRHQVARPAAHHAVPLGSSHRAKAVGHIAVRWFSVARDEGWRMLSRLFTRAIPGGRQHTRSRTVDTTRRRALRAIPLIAILAIAGLFALTLVARSLNRGAGRDVVNTIDPVLQPRFDAIWERADLLVHLRQTDRGWTWGPAPVSTMIEPYRQAAGGKRLVQYYDKGRIEINDPTDPGNITMGLLVRELVSGHVAVGDDPADIESREPASIPVAGDPPEINPDAPTYASFHAVASPPSDAGADDRTGTPVTASLNQRGDVGHVPAGALAPDEHSTIAAYEPTTRHNIPRVFWRFLHRNGAVYEQGQPRPYEAVLSSWQSVVGLPITEPYWINTNVAGTPRWILVQLFERRVLTYTPANDPPHQVEMGNTGVHYLAWRYGSVPERAEAIQATSTFLSSTSAEIAWSADLPHKAEVLVGTVTTDLRPLASSQDHALSGTATLEALAPGTRYFWRVTGQDKHGRTNRSPLNALTTPDPNMQAICLTFDDGPIAGTETVLDMLGGKVPAAFFVTGANMAAHPEQQAALIRRMLREGHQVANHTFSHVPMFIYDYHHTYGTLSDGAAVERFRENYAHNERHFRSLLEQDEPLFRFARLPGAGQAIEHDGRPTYVDATNAMGLVHVGWNFELAPNGRFGQVFAANWQGIPGLAATSPDLPKSGDILLLHDSHFRDKGALLKTMIDTLQSKGFTFGRLDQSGACSAW